MRVIILAVIDNALGGKELMGRGRITDVHDTQLSQTFKMIHFFGTSFLFCVTFAIAAYRIWKENFVVKELIVIFFSVIHCQCVFLFHPH